MYFHRFETFGRNADKDWVMALPDGERVLGCATGGGWGAVITRLVPYSLVIVLDGFETIFSPCILQSNSFHLS